MASRAPVIADVPRARRVRDFVLVSVAAISHTLPRLLNQTEFRNAEAIQ